MLENKMTTYVKVPMDRVAVIIGPDGSTKDLIEKKSAARLNIDSQNGSIEITDPSDPLMAMRAAEVIKAVGRGFSPDKVLRLFDDDMLTVEIMDLSHIADTPKELKRLKGRIIGKGGKSREIFENLTGCNISVMGKTVSLLGHMDQILVARTGIEMLIKGSPHGPVFSFLEKKRRELKENRW
ncbi:MAG: KH domain-containing protein [ANME-2 cluster archaeon]|nr:KH domain-containing protein [ANME-2 cluster archaeon]